MGFLFDVWNRVKTRITDLLDSKQERLFNYESLSTVLGLILVFFLSSNHELIYAKIWLFVFVFYGFSVYLILKKPNKRGL